MNTAERLGKMYQWDELVQAERVVRSIYDMTDNWDVWHVWEDIVRAIDIRNKIDGIT